MYDGFKIAAHGTRSPAWLALPQLDFTGQFSASTGEILDSELIAQSRAVNFRIKPDGSLFLEGSLHRFARNGGGNLDDFTADQVARAINELEQNFAVVPWVAAVQKLEFGVNLDLRYPAEKLIRGILATPKAGNGAGLLQMDAHRTDLGKVAKFTDYNLKIYDKVRQQGKPGARHILRIEIKIVRPRFLLKLGIRTLADLKKPSVQETIGKLLADTVSGLIIYNKELARKRLTTKERLKEKDFANPIFWQGKRGKARQKAKKEFESLLSTHNVTPAAAHLTKQVAAKWAELTAHHPQPNAPLLPQNKACGGTMPSNKPASQPAHLAPITPKKKLNKPKSSKTRLCAHCGADISHKRTDAKYCDSACRKANHRQAENKRNLRKNNNKKTESNQKHYTQQNNANTTQSQKICVIKDKNVNTTLKIKNTITLKRRTNTDNQILIKCTKNTKNHHQRARIYKSVRFLKISILQCIKPRPPP